MVLTCTYNMVTSEDDYTEGKNLDNREHCMVPILKSLANPKYFQQMKAFNSYLRIRLQVILGRDGLLLILL